MMSDELAWLAEFEQRQRIGVRRQIESNFYDGAKLTAAYKWLDDQEAGPDRALAREANEIARASNAIALASKASARFANFVAILALIVAATAVIVAAMTNPAAKAWIGSILSK